MEISEKTLKFIKDHAADDVNALRLKFLGKVLDTDFPVKFAILQIEARRKARKKIPSFLENPNFAFPDCLAAEQATNEAVAKFHASLIPAGNTLLDLTAGLGIDDFTFASKGVKLISCEINSDRFHALEHNARVLGLDNCIIVKNVDSMDYVESCNRKFDMVFADPARRGAAGRRVHALSDCQPDILTGMESIMNVTDRLLVKSSPLLDLTFIRETVEGLTHIYIVCFKGECKEILIEIAKERSYTGTTVVDLDMNGEISRFECHRSPTVSESNIRFTDRKVPSEYKYLYEPNSGVMKTGAWDELSRQFPALRKTDSNTHLFCSDTLYQEFPGRVINITSEADKKTLKELKGTKLNVVTRNYPLLASEVAKKYSLIPGGDGYLYAFRYKGKPVCVTGETVIRSPLVQE